MINNNQTLGLIFKEEKVASLDFNIIDKTLVLEAVNPYPGYYRDDNKSKEKISVYMVSKNSLDIEIVARLANKIKPDLDFDFTASYSTVCIKNSTFNTIRFFEIDDYSKVIKIQKALIKNNFEFEKFQKINGEALIRVSKFLKIEVAEDVLFIDGDTKDFLYFEISKELNWNKFRDLTIGIRNSWKLANFDAALGSVFLDGQIHEIIRIYSKNANLNDFREIRKRFLEKI